MPWRSHGCANRDILPYNWTRKVLQYCWKCCWIELRGHNAYCRAHQELTETVKFTLKHFGYGQAILLKILWAAFPRSSNTKQTWWTAPHLKILRRQSQQELQIFYNKFLLRIKNWCNFFPSKMVKLAGRTPTGLLLLPQYLVKDSLVIQCPHILINIAGHMGVAATRVTIAATSYLEKITIPQWRAGWTG